MEFSMPMRAKLFVAITAAAGAALLGTAMLQWRSDDLLKFVCYLLIAVLASTMKVRLPGMESTMSVNFLFVILGVLELSLAETMVIGCIAALVQSLWKTKQRPEAVKVIQRHLPDLLRLSPVGEAASKQHAPVADSGQLHIFSE
jgi:hypothetical protein